MSLPKQPDLSSTNQSVRTAFQRSTKEATTAVTLFEIQRIAADADGFPGMTMGAEFIDLPIPWLRQEKDTSLFFPAKMAICPGGSPYFDKPTGVDHTTAEKNVHQPAVFAKLMHQAPNAQKDLANP